jgi:hypothetical protein
MRSIRFVAVAAALAAALGIGFASGRAQEAKQARKILAVYGVGGVLCDDGVLWQYMPEGHRWITIDAAFESEGRETHILPLPVKAQEVVQMQSWGFLVTRSGDAWHYDLNENRWENVGAP